MKDHILKISQDPKVDKVAGPNGISPMQTSPTGNQIFIQPPPLKLIFMRKPSFKGNSQ